MFGQVDDIVRTLNGITRNAPAVWLVFGILES